MGVTTGVTVTVLMDCTVGVPQIELGTVHTPLLEGVAVASTVGIGVATPPDLPVAPATPVAVLFLVIG